MNQIKSLDINLNKPDTILNRIKDTPITGSDHRGTPLKLEVRDIVKYTTKQGKCVYEGPKALEQHPEYLSELVNKNGILSKENIGKIYHLTTTHPNSNKSDPITGTSTSFQYRIFNDGTEDLYLDAIPFGHTPLFWNEDKTPTKINNSSLCRIVKEMNPQSKLI